MKKIIDVFLFASLFIVGNANAAFVDAYQVSNWAQAINGGSINTTGAPSNVVMTSSNNGGAQNKRQDFTIAAAANGVVSFSWSYVTSDTRANPVPRDPFGYLLNGLFTKLTAGNSNTQTGVTTFNVLAGQVFGFRMLSTDSLNGSASTTISNFNGPVPAIPVPAALWLMVVPIMSILGGKRKKTV